MNPADEPICRFSPCERYRYTLFRDVNPATQGLVAFICLNPSTADATNDDPTVRRCMGFTRDWGYRWFCILNVFAYRATDPRDMKRQTDPVGIDNHHHVLRVASTADRVVAAWGTHGEWQNGDLNVRRWLNDIAVPLKCLGKTMHGHPKHPLYLRADSQLIDYP